MENKVVERGADSSIHLRHLSHEAAKAKVLLEDIIEDGKRQAERSLKRGRFALQDCIVETTYRIKRHPWESICAAMSLGTAVGFLVGWFGKTLKSRHA